MGYSLYKILPESLAVPAVLQPSVLSVRHQPHLSPHSDHTQSIEYGPRLKNGCGHLDVHRWEILVCTYWVRYGSSGHLKRPWIDTLWKNNWTCGVALQIDPVSVYTAQGARKTSSNKPLEQRTS